MADDGAAAPEVPKGGGGHPIQWVEARAKDLDRASEFYGEAFGWELSAFGDSYRVCLREGRLGMGFSAGLKEELPDSLFYVSVPDIDKVVGRAAELGATVFEPKQPIGPDMPNSAMLRNADGVFVGLVDGTPSPQPYVPRPWSAPEPVEPGSICSVEIHGGADLKSAERFYGGLFGWGTAPMGPQYLAFDPGAGVGGVFQSHTPTLPVVIYVYVEDVDASIVRIEAAGGKRMGDPMEMPGMGVFGYFGDPNGVAMGLIGPGRGA